MWYLVVPGAFFVVMGLLVLLQFWGAERWWRVVPCVIGCVSIILGGLFIYIS